MRAKARPVVAIVRLMEGDKPIQIRRLVGANTFVNKHYLAGLVSEGFNELAFLEAMKWNEVMCSVPISETASLAGAVVLDVPVGTSRAEAEELEEGEGIPVADWDDEPVMA